MQAFGFYHKNEPYFQIFATIITIIVLHRRISEGVHFGFWMSDTHLVLTGRSLIIHAMVVFSLPANFWIPFITFYSLHPALWRALTKTVAKCNRGHQSGHKKQPQRPWLRPAATTPIPHPTTNRALHPGVKNNTNSTTSLVANPSMEKWEFVAKPVIFKTTVAGPMGHVQRYSTVNLYAYNEWVFLLLVLFCWTRFLRRAPFKISTYAKFPQIVSSVSLTSTEIPQKFASFHRN